MQPIFKETNRLRAIRRFVAGYACLIAGMFGLIELIAGNVIGLGKTEPVPWILVVPFICLLISGGCNLLATKPPDK